MNSTIAFCPPIAESCPKCVSNILDKQLIANLCNFSAVIQSSSINYSKSLGSYGNDDLKSSCGSSVLLKVFKSTKDMPSKLNLSINSKCECKELSESSFIIFSKSESWSASGLSLSDQHFILYGSYSNQRDTKKMLERDGCNALQQNNWIRITRALLINLFK
jgi:hypothetical protein